MYNSLWKVCLKVFTVNVLFTVYNKYTHSQQIIFPETEIACSLFLFVVKEKYSVLINNKVAVFNFLHYCRDKSCPINTQWWLSH